MNALGIIGLFTIGVIAVFQVFILDEALDPIMEDKVDINMRV